MKRVEYFHSTLMFPGQRLDAADNPASGDFLPMEMRSEMDRARWWADWESRRRKLESLSRAEMHPVRTFFFDDFGGIGVDDGEDDDGDDDSSDDGHDDFGDYGSGPDAGGYGGPGDFGGYGGGGIDPGFEDPASVGQHAPPGGLDPGFDGPGFFEPGGQLSQVVTEIPQVALASYISRSIPEQLQALGENFRDADNDGLIDSGPFAGLSVDHSVPTPGFGPDGEPDPDGEPNRVMLPERPSWRLLDGMGGPEPSGGPQPSSGDDAELLRYRSSFLSPFLSLRRAALGVG